MSGDFSSSSPPEGHGPNDVVVQVIEGETTTRDTLVAMLTEQSYACQAFESAEAYLASPVPSQRACIVLDDQLQRINGSSVQQRLVDRASAMPLVVITNGAELPIAMRFMEREATSVITKPFTTSNLATAVARSIQLSEVHRRVRDRFTRIGASVERLSPREQTVLKAISEGQLNKAIARSLDVSVRTVEGDRAKIVEKFQAETTGEVVGKFAQYTLLTEIGYPDSGTSVFTS